MLFFLTWFLQAFSSAQAGEITVSAGVGLRDVITSVYDEYRATHPDAVVRFNFASAGPLAKQIEKGAPVDIFVPAHTRWMDYLVSLNHVNGETVRFFAGNTLVVMGLGKRPIASLKELTALNRIAIGLPGSVPVGDYAVQSLKAACAYEALVSGNKLVMGRDVRQTLAYADRGEADAALVYKTDALRAERAVILYTVPSAFHETIVYTMGMTVAGEKKDEARAFYAYIGGNRATEIIKAYGFDVSVRGERRPGP